ncbi:hypothetical protein SLEP1_g6302 [Rubroshorea leprosula]|uniref:RNase H type-1 domain-containing protein n=1 Tax=Rubroshorea leprosula TaxID=152421 RepID=A0AAV5I4I2_9ROSI|nr:hypothetical protein SLEP1_g6302 [Rubroshorea leprosula]
MKIDLAIPFQDSCAQPDTFIWGFSSDGLFKSKSAYYLSKNIARSDDSWSWIWKIHTLPRVNYFVWLLRHGRLLTFDTLFNWGISESSICPRCHQTVETINHIFRKSNFSKSLWDLLTPYPINTLFHDTNFNDWVFAHATYSDTSQLGDWSTSFSFITWSIWYFRNQLVHGGKSFSIDVARDFILSKIDEFNQIHHTASKPKTSTTILIGWTPPHPPSGVIKLNTDGSAITNPGAAGAGGVFRDELGNWLLSFYCSIGFTTSLSAELWALRNGLRLAVDRGYSNLIVEIDSRITKILLDSANSNFHSLGVLIDDCRAMMSQIPALQINHIYREANALADGLAKKGAKSDSSFVALEQSPSELCNLLFSDCIGTMFPRNIVMR